MTKTKLAFFMTGLLGVAGCSGSDMASEAVGTDSQAILGGEENTGDPAVVAIYGAKPGEEKGAFCTGTVISPTVVLTAAHCVDPRLVGDGVEFRVVAAPKVEKPIDPAQVLAVKETHFHPEFDGKNILKGFDIAVLILASPTNITPIPWNRAPLSPTAQGKDVRLVGYGLNDGFFQKGAGTKRQLTTSLGSVDDKLISTGTFGKSICSGDSGGPVLMEIDGKETVVGVNSFGIIFCIGPGNSTRVDAYSDFVSKYVD